MIWYNIFYYIKRFKNVAVFCEEKMFSKQEQFEKETLERLYGFVDSNYALYDTYGRKAKPDFISIVNLARNVFGNGDSDFSTILNLIEKYCSCDIENVQTFQIEEKLLKGIVIVLDNYMTAYAEQLETLRDKSRYMFSDIADEEKKDIDVRKNDLRYVVRKANATSMLDTMACFKMYFDGLMFGMLPAEPLPESKKASNSEFTAKKVPLFTHEPVSTDIPKDKTGPLFDGLRALAETNALFIKKMLRDCSNGNVYVRLYDPDNNFAPEYIEAEKADACKKWAANGGYSKWPAYIISALQAKGIDINSGSEDLLGRILGNGENKIDIPADAKAFKVKSAYNNCGLALYANLLTTNSNMIEESKEYSSLLDSLQEFIACFSLSTASKQARDAAMNLLKQHSDSFKKQAASSEKRMQKRILVCDAIDTMFEIYSTHPDENPLEILRAKYPQLKL